MKRLRLFLAVTLVVALVLGGIWGLVALRHHQQVSRDRASNAAAEKTVPVDMAAAKTADVPVYVDGIGTVQALNSVSVHPMVDGPLVAVKFHEGQDVRAGEVLAQIDPRTYQATLDQALGKKAQDEANLRNALLDLGRYQKLAKTQYTTAQQADTQRATVEQDQALIQQDQAQIDSARTNLSYTTIQAPAAGRTGLRQVDQGNIVHSTDTTPITVVTTLRPIDVVFTLPQQTLPDVVKSMQAGHPAVLALPQNGDPNAVIDRGVLKVLDNEVDQTTGTIKLKAEFPNADLTLWPGAFVNVRLALRTDHDVVTVPVAAVQRGPSGAFLYVVDKAGVAHRRAIVVSHQDEAVAVVASGLQAGEQVITDGASRVTDGAHVRRMTA